MAESRNRRTSAAVLTVTAALSVALTAGCASAHSDASVASAKRVAHAAPASVLRPSVPDHLTIPAIKVDTKLDTVGLDGSGVMQTPPYDKPMEASWYKQGPTPGEKGAAVIAGHMDTPEAPEAVFHNLKDLKKHQKIDIRREDGTTAVFKVDAVQTYAKSAFPTEKVYGKTNKAELRLITCGGHLTKDRHWDSNVVVFAHLTGDRKA
ncbi:Sortase family protein [Streptomyces sp. YIM 130001]|uniref:class F sortase n=1 Tax=Streptomyces sp. YIM 130001 TaxID=2259644 RepID=UPI000E647D1F|nr:class F sortase [Streptomyces sp. YIM 130001]RII15781.1 Sortase family protein [Streptomyces sp. YIM 130001]